MGELLTSWEVNGQRKLLLGQITDRFGPLSDAELLHLNNYGAEDLALLARAVFTFRTLDDVKAWIAAHPRWEWVDPLGEEEDDPEGET